MSNTVKISTATKSTQIHEYSIIPREFARRNTFFYRSCFIFFCWFFSILFFAFAFSHNFFLLIFAIKLLHTRCCWILQITSAHDNHCIYTRMFYTICCNNISVRKVIHTFLMSLMIFMFTQIIIYILFFLLTAKNTLANKTFHGQRISILLPYDWILYSIVKES